MINLISFSSFLNEAKKDNPKDKNSVKKEQTNYTETEIKRLIIDHILDNDTKFISKILKNKFDINFNGGEALLIASEFSNETVVKFLIDNGADIKKYGNNALLSASKTINLNVAKLLIYNGADVKYNNNQAIISACKYECDDKNKSETTKKINFIKILIESGADINARDSSPIIISVKDDQYSVVNFLLDNGVDLTKDILKSIQPYTNDKMQKIIDKYKNK